MATMMGQDGPLLWLAVVLLLLSLGLAGALLTATRRAGADHVGAAPADPSRHWGRRIP